MLFSLLLSSFLFWHENYLSNIIEIFFRSQIKFNVEKNGTKNIEHENGEN